MTDSRGVTVKKESKWDGNGNNGANYCGNKRKRDREIGGKQRMSGYRCRILREYIWLKIQLMGNWQFDTVCVSMNFLLRRIKLFYILKKNASISLDRWKIGMIRFLRIFFCKNTLVLSFLWKFLAMQFWHLMVTVTS